MRSGSLEYELDEFQPLKGFSMYVYGTAEILWEFERADRDVGETCDYAFSIGDIILASDVKGKGLTLPESSELYGMIVDRLRSSDYDSHILSAIKKDDE